MNDMNDLDSLSKYDIKYFQVVHNNRRAMNYPLSEPLETVEQARSCLSKIKELVPDARISKCGWLFSSEDEPGRHEILKDIIKA